MMLHEVYNITDQGMQRVLDSLAHPPWSTPYNKKSAEGFSLWDEL